MPLFVGRKLSINAITQAMGGNKYIFLATQKDDKVEKPQNNDLHKVGTLAIILQMLKLPDGTIKVLVEGVKRAKIEEVIELKKELRELQRLVEFLCKKVFEDNRAKHV
jgi:ATP-dependent Lon protease